ncbi:uncharacterized protein E5676_scaffold142G001280 [Cucumis melo var. makuwa]|uniref:Retrotransposon gag domain-containing protein n=1 Tax=Cucumis melo var. makuwa TaxID=1194695 RepID=A0A5D3DIB9_CUCMM|nr:uncharacterized protein E5676_scaffold142G001280 [Cucumis melo var. makuwa]
MLYLVEVPDSICYLKSCLEEISKKAGTIDAVAGHVEGLPIQELLVRVDTLEANVGRTINYELGDRLSGFVAHMEERVNELDSFHKTLLEMINGMSEDFRTTLDVIRNEIADDNVRLNLTVRAMANQAPTGGAISRSWYVDMQEGRCTIDTWDTLKKELRSQFFLENVEILARRELHELKHTDSFQEYVKQFTGLMLDIRDMSKKDKVFCFFEGLKSDSQDMRHHQSSSPGRNRNSRPSSPRAVEGDKRSGPHLARECPNKADFHAFQTSLTPYSDDKSSQAEGETNQIEGGEKPRIRALKYMSSLKKKGRGRSISMERGLLYVDTWINKKQTKSIMIDSDVTHNFITETEARHLRLRWEKNLGRMKVVNFVGLPIVGLVKRTVIKLGGWKCPADFVIIKMDDFNVVLGMEFLLEHQVIPMPSAKCLVITGSFHTVVQADIHQPNGFKMISAMQQDKNPV